MLASSTSRASSVGRGSNPEPRATNSASNDFTKYSHSSSLFIYKTKKGKGGDVGTASTNRLRSNLAVSRCVFGFSLCFRFFLLTNCAFQAARHRLHNERAVCYRVFFVCDISTPEFDRLWAADAHVLRMYECITTLNSESLSKTEAIFNRQLTISNAFRLERNDSRSFRSTVEKSGKR